MARDSELPKGEYLSEIKRSNGTVLVYRRTHPVTGKVQKIVIGNAADFARGSDRLQRAISHIRSRVEKSPAKLAPTTMQQLIEHYKRYGFRRIRLRHPRQLREAFCCPSLRLVPRYKRGKAPRNLLNSVESISPRRLARPRTSPFHTRCSTYLQRLRRGGWHWKSLKGRDRISRSVPQPVPR